MNISLMRLAAFLLVIFPAVAFAVEVTGTGSMIPGPLIKVWADAYSAHSNNSVIKYQGSSPADGIKRLVNKEVDFSCIDIPLNKAELKKNGLEQFPFALGAVTPVVNLPNVTPGYFRLDGKALADIFLGNIKKWNDPVIVELNPDIKLPDADIIIIHRASPPGVRTIIGDYLAKNHPQWKAIKGSTMAGSWPETSIVVKDATENFEMIQKTKYSIGYGPVSVASKQGLSYVKMKNKAGNFVSPSDESISAAAESSTWGESNGFDVDLTDQAASSSWPLSMASFVLIRKSNEHPERSKEVLKYFKYSIRFGAFNAVQHDAMPLPEAVKAVVRRSLDSIIDEKSLSVSKN